MTLCKKSLFGIVFIAAISAYCWLAYTKSDKPFNNGFNNGFGCATEDITDMYEGYIEDWKLQISAAFSQAEKAVFKTNPTPDVVGPDPDPNKCICKGSGWILQGDGHKTPCPYHGKKMSKITQENDLIYKPLLILE